MPSQPVPPGSTTNQDAERRLAEYRAKHPDKVSYLRSLPRDRLENYALLRLIELEDAREQRLHSESEIATLRRATKEDVL